MERTIGQELEVVDFSHALSLERDDQALRQELGILPQQEIERQRQELLRTPHRSVAILGAGAGAVEATRLLLQKRPDLMVYVFNDTPQHGGRAILHDGISSVIHMHTKVKRARAALSVFSDPRVILRNSTQTDPLFVKEILLSSGFDAVIDAHGGKEKRLPGIDYTVRDVQSAAGLTRMFNDQVDSGKSLLDLQVVTALNAQGIPLDAILQGGGKVAHEDGTSDLVLWQWLKAAQRTGAMPEHLLQKIAREPYLFVDLNNLHELIEGSGVDMRQAGNTHHLYRGEYGYMRLFEPKEGQTRDSVDLQAKILKDAYQGAMNRYFIPYENALITGARNDDQPGVIVTWQDKDGEHTKRAGLVVTAIGYDPDPMDLEVADTIPHAVVGMAKDGRGDIGATISSVKRGVEQILPHIPTIPPTDRQQHEERVALATILAQETGFDGNIVKQTLQTYPEALAYHVVHGAPHILKPAELHQIFSN